MPRGALDGTKEEKVGVEYSDSPVEGEPLDLVLFDKDIEPTDTLETKPLEVEQQP